MQNAFKTLISGILETVKSYKSDWNENNSSSPNYIKNKPFGDKTTSVLFDLFTDWDKDIGLVLGENYTVNFNGETYVCEAKDSEYGVFIGDEHLWNEDSEEPELPFCYGNGWCDFSEEPQVFTISGDAYTTIPTKFLPAATDTVRGIMSFQDWNKLNSPRVDVYVGKTTFQDLYKMFYSNIVKTNCTFMCHLEGGTHVHSLENVTIGANHPSKLETDSNGNKYLYMGVKSDMGVHGNVLWLKINANNLLEDAYYDFLDVIIPSSTEGSTKKFKITVDDGGTISAREVS